MTNTLPTTMKALEAAAAGPVANMKIVATRPVPTLTKVTSGEPAVIVKVQCAALNPVDWKMAEYSFMVDSWPHVFGCDMSGTVVAASDGATAKEGDKVWAYSLLGMPHSGALAEYVRVPDAMLGRVPDSVSMEGASTLGVGSLTAAFGLFRSLKLPTTAPSLGFPVLVYGASSNVGAFALALLKAGGYRAIAVASAQHHEWLKDTLGAAQCVDYKDEGWKDAIAAAPENAGLKFTFDGIGGATPAAVDEVMEKCGATGAGKIATVDPGAPASFSGKSELLPVDIGSIKYGELLKEAKFYVKLVDDLLAEGKMFTMPTKVIGGLDAAVEGMEMLKAGKVRGEKLVVTI